MNRRDVDGAYYETLVSHAEGVVLFALRSTKKTDAQDPCAGAKLKRWSALRPCGNNNYPLS